MTGLWKVFFWINHVFIALNAVVFSCFLMPISSWYIMPCLIVTALCMAPIFYSLMLWLAIKDRDIGHLYLFRLFFRKAVMSLPLILLIIAWSWWSGGMAIFGGGIVASWLGNIIFWTFKRHDLLAVLPETGESRQSVRHQLPDANGVVPVPLFSAMTGSISGYVNTGATETHATPFASLAANISSVANVSSDTQRYDTFNPASGLPMVNSAFDSQGNVYGTSSSCGHFEY